MKQLTENDLLDLRVNAQVSGTKVTIDREDFDCLMDSYQPYRHDYYNGFLVRASEE